MAQALDASCSGVHSPFLGFTLLVLPARSEFYRKIIHCFVEEQRVQLAVDHRQRWGSRDSMEMTNIFRVSVRSRHSPSSLFANAKPLTGHALQSEFLALICKAF
jgi:hypothetical protein